MTGYPVRTMGSMVAAVLAMGGAMFRSGNAVAEMNAKMKEVEIADRPFRFDCSSLARFRHGGKCNRRRKTNRLHLSKKAKIAKRRAR